MVYLGAFALKIVSSRVILIILNANKVPFHRKAGYHMKFAADFRREARTSLTGNWPTAVITAVIASMLGGSTSGPTINIDADAISTYIGEFRSFPPSGISAPPFFNSIMLGAVTFGAIIAVALFIFGGAVEVGYCAYNMNLLSGYEAKISHLFSYFNIFGRALGCRLLRALYVFLWSLLFIIPGIIKTYSYAMAPYVLAAHPDISADEAITESRRLMRGNKGRLFCLDLSFIGWSLLCILSLGIGFLWLIPYISASRAAFFLEISSTQNDMY